MKANHISAERRLSNRISKLEIRLDDAFKQTRKRFYPYCRYCEHTNIQVSMDGHASHCPMKGVDKEIEYYKGLLDKLRNITMGYNATVVICLDRLHDIKEDQNFGRDLSYSILKVNNRGVQDGPHGTVVVESHHADHLVPVIVGGNYGRVIPAYIGIDPNEHIDTTNVRILKAMAEKLGYRVSKIPQKVSK